MGCDNIYIRYGQSINLINLNIYVSTLDIYSQFNLISNVLNCKGNTKKLEILDRKSFEDWITFVQETLNIYFDCFVEIQVYQMSLLFQVTFLYLNLYTRKGKPNVSCLVDREFGSVKTCGKVSKCTQAPMDPNGRQP